MSVFNGYKDVLVRKDGEVFKVDGLSPLGFAWIETNIAFTASFHKSEAGSLVGRIAHAGLSVEVR